MRLLIVEDNETLADWLAKLLRGSNYVVDCVHDGESAAHGTDLKNYDLLIVDLTLPGMSGIDLIRHVRGKGLSTPILILTAKDAVQNRVEGLDAGADDYLTKPFEIEELDARLRALWLPVVRSEHAPVRGQWYRSPFVAAGACAARDAAEKGRHDGE